MIGERIKTFYQESLFEINQWIEQQIKSNQLIQFQVLNPDLEDRYSGEIVTIEEQDYRYRGYKVWINLAELHLCKMLTPKIQNNHLVEISFKRIKREDSFHTAPIQNQKEKYGVASPFFRINKNEEPTFLLAYQRALTLVKVAKRKHILNLGINKGDEFELIQELIGKESFKKINFSGIDHAQSTLDFAQRRFGANVALYNIDINHLKRLQLPPADLIISIGTLQSPSIPYKPFLMSLVQEHLTKDGALILGFPNSRWMGGELIYGAKAPNYPYSEMSLLYNDVIFAKKYLQQKKFRVTITGREYIFLTATKIKR